VIAETYRVIVVTPVYEDAEASGRLFQELGDLLGQDVFVVAVDDGSLEQPLTAPVMQDALVEGVILRLRRNYGHQRAIAVGLAYASEQMHAGQRVVVMDSDGEDVPSTIPALLTELDPHRTDVVVAQRKSRVETLRFKTFYMLYKLLFKLLTGRSISFGNFMALKAHAVKRLVAIQELPIHVAGTVLASKLRIKVCPLDRGRRYAGQSRMNFVGLALHGFKGLMVFTEDVLVRVGTACALTAILSVLAAVAATILKLIGFSTPGWFSVALGILVLMFLQTGALALMTLLLTGIMRDGSVTSAINYHQFVEEILETGS
jgi:glycosyltransferase involved in cell wall biosynthesis